MSHEIKWKTIDGYDRYEVSTDGQVRVLYSRGSSKKGKILKTKINRGGYLEVALYNNYKIKQVRIHRLLALAFLKKSEYNLVLHCDGNKLNNSLDNLRWGNHSQNLLDRRKHGTVPRFHKRKKSNLNPELIEKVRKSHLTYKEIANQFSISVMMAWRIKNTTNWYDMEKD